MQPHMQTQAQPHTQLHAVPHAQHMQAGAEAAASKHQTLLTTHSTGSGEGNGILRSDSKRKRFSEAQVGSCALQAHAAC